MNFKSKCLFSLLALMVSFGLGLLVFKLVNFFIKDNESVSKIVISFSDKSHLSKAIPFDEISITDKSNEIPFRNFYSNYEYAYSVSIPTGLAAYKNAPPQPNHGFRLFLSEQPKSFVFVDGSYNALFWTSLYEAANFNLECIKENSSDVEILSRIDYRLQNLKAVRMKVKYKSSDTNEVGIKDIILALRKQNGGSDIEIVYKLELTTPINNYPKNVVSFEQIVKGFKTKPLPQ